MASVSPHPNPLPWGEGTACDASPDSEWQPSCDRQTVLEESRRPNFKCEVPKIRVSKAAVNRRTPDDSRNLSEQRVSRQSRHGGRVRCFSTAFERLTTERLRYWVTPFSPDVQFGSLILRRCGERQGVNAALQRSTKHPNCKLQENTRLQSSWNECDLWSLKYGASLEIAGLGFGISPDRAEI